jgi:hypothetical protein
MESSMAETLQEKHWYLAVGDRSIGPLTTELVAKGIQSGKVPLTAWICQVGASSWSALSSFGEFQDIVDRVLAAEVPANQQSAGRPEPGASVSSESSTSRGTRGERLASESAETASTTDEDEATGKRGTLPYEQTEPDETCVNDAENGQPDFVTSAPSVLPVDVSGSGVARHELSSISEGSGPREALPELGGNVGEAVGEAHAATIGAFDAHDDLGIDITFDEESDRAVDWNERFQSYFLVGTEVELPEEERLLQSLSETPRSTFLHDEALWNLSLCLAFGSERVAATSAKTFFDAVGVEHGPERIEWICRTLLSKGFMPSGIPRSDGMRGVELLREACPVELMDVLTREALD